MLRDQMTYRSLATATTRRAFLKRAAAAGVAVPALVGGLVACGGEEAAEAGQDLATRIPDAPGAPPNVPLTPAASPAAAGAASPAAPAGAAAAPAAPAGGAVTIEGVDIAWVYNGVRSGPNQPVMVPVTPGQTISLPNNGASPHNFVVETLDNVVHDMPVGQTIEYVVPDDAPQGDHDFICNLPGHAQAGMIGVLQVQPAGAAAPPPAGEQAAAPPAGGAPAAGGPITIEGVDIAWVYNGQRSAPGQPVRVEVAPGTEISLPNNGASPHNFVVEELDNQVIDMPVGQTATYTVPADAAPGEYEFICNLPGHAQAGMASTLVVTG